MSGRVRDDVRAQGPQHARARCLGRARRLGTALPSTQQPLPPSTAPTADAWGRIVWHCTGGRNYPELFRRRSRESLLETAIKTAAVLSLLGVAQQHISPRLPAADLGLRPIGIPSYLFVPRVVYSNHGE